MTCSILFADDQNMFAATMAYALPTGSTTLVDRVEDLPRRKADIAMHNAEPTPGALVTRRLPAVDLGFHAHLDYLACRGVPATLAGLPGHDLLGFDAETPALRAMLAHLPGVDRNSFALRTDSNLAQLAAIRAAFGTGLCQTTIARADPTLVRVLDGIPSLRRCGSPCTRT